MTAIACVFKKFAEANARWYDAGERVERNVQFAKTLRPSTSSGQAKLRVSGLRYYKFSSAPRNKYAGDDQLLMPNTAQRDLLSMWPCLSRRNLRLLSKPGN